jgi:peptidoglycan/LPS O-acetylase OafA/YrhL
MTFRRVNQERLDSIDALRGLAALMVVICHARAEVWVGASYFWRNPSLRFSPVALLGYLSMPFSYGFLGVQLLFVISGYCIHRRNAKKFAEGADEPFSIRSYYRRRFVRIYPTLIAALILTWAVDTIVAFSIPPDPAQSDTLRTAVFNLFALQGLVAPHFGSNIVLWTMAIEIQFYLVYPLLLTVRRKWGALKALALVLAISLASSLIVLLFNLKAALPFWNGGCPIFLVYWFTWTCGFFVAEAEFNTVKLPAYLTQAGCVSLVLALLMRKFNLAPLDELLLAVAAASLVAAAVSKVPSQNRLLKVLQLVGVFSYSLYITHRPVNYLLKTLVPVVAEQHLWLTTVCFVTVVCVLFGWLFYQLVECWSLRARPFETLIPNFERQPSQPPVPVA